MTNSADYIDALTRLVPGDQPVGAVALAAMQEKAVGKAMISHSRSRPLRIVEDVAGTGGFDYALDALESFESDFSSIILVEYPVDDGSQNTAALDTDAWTIYPAPDGNKLRFLTETPAVGETIRITYTARHTCYDTGCTVPDADTEPVQSLAAHFLCRMLAAAHALDQDSTIQADSVNQAGRRKEYEALARAYKAEYNDHMGITEGKPKASCVVKDQDVIYPDGTDRLTHSRWTR